MMSLEGVRRGIVPSKHLVYWIAIFWVWANAHAGFIVGLGLAGLYTMEFVRSRRLSIVQGMAWLALILAVTLATPLGVSLWKGILSCLSTAQADIEEYLPPPWSHMSVFWLAFGLFLLLCASSIERKTSLTWIAWIIFLIFGYAAVRHARYVPFFMLAAFPFAIESAFTPTAGWRRGWPAQGFRQEWLSALLIVLALLQLPHVTFGTLSRQVPVGVCNFIAANRLGGRFFNDYDFGSYWIWRFDGNPAVFIDGRFPTVEGYRPLKEEIQQAQRGSPGDWQNFLNRYDITAVATRTPDPSVQESVFISYFPKNRWALVYQDHVALLFLKRSAYPGLHLGKDPAL
jgi:hypothetical protein